MSELQYWIWFASLKIMPIKKNNLLNFLGSPQKIYKANEKKLLEVVDINLEDILEITNNKNEKLIKKYEEYINKNEISVISINDKLYPNALKEIYDPPCVIFAKGNLKLLNSKGVAIVGSRMADEYGMKASYNFAYDLAKKNIIIVSRTGERNWFYGT